MKYKMMPVFSIFDLEIALCAQYGSQFTEQYSNLRSVLFGDCYINDSYMSYNIKDIAENLEPWMDETHWRIETCVKTFLCDIFPEHEYVLIDVSW